MPIIQYATPPGVVWQDITFGPFLVGQFLGALITFLLVVVVIFLIVKVSERANVK